MIELSSLSYYGNPLISSLYGCITPVQLCTAIAALLVVAREDIC
jgi:hypothetical protein